MEIHPAHHGITSKKRFGEYLLEFLLLFLAVTLGFFAENIRENISHRDIERLNIKDIVEDLASDTSQLAEIIQTNEQRLKGIDSFLTLRKFNPEDPEIKRKFYQKSYTYLTSEDYFRPNDAALGQMESSGALRLIKKRRVAGDILKYETKTKFDQHPGVRLSRPVSENLDRLGSAVDFTLFKETSLSRVSLDSFTFNFSSNELPEIASDKVLLKGLFNYASLLYLANSNYLVMLKQQFVNAKDLINLLKKEYNIR